MALYRVGLSTIFSTHLDQGLIHYIQSVGAENIIAHLPDSMMHDLRKSILAVSPKRYLVDHIMSEHSYNTKKETESPVITNDSNSLSSPLTPETPSQPVHPEPVPETSASDSIPEPKTHDDISIATVVGNVKNECKADVTLAEAKKYWKQHQSEYPDQYFNISVPYPNVCSTPRCPLCLSWLFTAEITPCSKGCSHPFPQDNVLYPHISRAGFKKLKHLHSLKIVERPLISGSQSNTKHGFGTVMFMYQAAKKKAPYALHPVIKSITTIFNSLCDETDELTFGDTDDDDPFPGVEESLPLKRVAEGRPPSVVSSKGHLSIQKKARRA